MKLTNVELNLIKEMIGKNVFPGTMARTVADLAEKIDNEIIVINDTIPDGPTEPGE